MILIGVAEVYNQRKRGRRKRRTRRRKTKRRKTKRRKSNLPVALSVTQDQGRRVGREITQTLDGPARASELRIAHFIGGRGSPILHNGWHLVPRNDGTSTENWCRLSRTAARARKCVNTTCTSQMHLDVDCCLCCLFSS